MEQYVLECQNDSIALRIRLLFYMHPAVDHAHDPISELLVDDRLQSGTSATIRDRTFIVINAP
jgi:hypothetical protein